jgi:pimeloyl-ACP methyl ester carboxylesterase
MYQTTMTRAIKPSLMIVTRVAVQAAQKQSPSVRVLLSALKAAERVSPSMAAAMMERLLFRAPYGPLPREGRAFLARGNPFELTVEGRRVVGWSWGEGPTTYLVHGWGSRAGRLFRLGEALVASGRRLVMFDAPGHGASGRGLTSMPEFARALHAVVQREGRPDAVVAHSMGGAATALAASWGLDARRFVLLAPAANPAEWARSIGSVLDLDKETMRRLRERSERRLRLNWRELDARVHARRMTAPLLVIHDHQDETVPFSHGADIARMWPGAILVGTSGLGHRDILNNPAVISQVLDFLAIGAPGNASAENTRLENALYNRGARLRAG